ncbi:hypothetical protein P170DRAFT_452871 [Aspergillus steynii IBT 23096]|uniref:Aminoglycoside phosphotransferase domain-containing protein n=1 Tax=Aspergillus steynii IBT 23096 TaxID=1392250 RepID=A0A2I2GRM4_9EURO|nr:uncharacterized protein P170DRAFT_452871 [Aspergillus steynii IBT 23096]PLB55527.1 hypothetical protein P170DRAFT_452871 [Aspergillus steynii IBT 23096]
MQYTRENLKLPVPKVLAYCSRAGSSKLGSEYVIMEKAEGIELGRIWDDLKSRDKLSIAKEIRSITCTLSRVKFHCYGALYRRVDISETESIKIDDTFAIEPTTGRAWFDDKREEIDIYRGPWANIKETINALAQRELAYLKQFSTFPRDCQQCIFNGPGGYHPTKEAKLAVLQDFLKVYQHVLPHEDSLNAAIPVYPMFLVTHHPSLIDYDRPKPERFVQPELPEDIQNMNSQDKKGAKELFLAQTLWLLYETQVYKEAHDLTRAFQYRETLQAEILGLIGSIFDDGEPHVQQLLAAATEPDAWKKLVEEDGDGNPIVGCPIQYSPRDIERQTEEYTKWQRDVERKAKVLEEIGVYSGWNGAVSPGDYDEVVRRLDRAKKRFLDRESRNPEERVLWEKAWPFEDKESS